jgi:hypothetical protein
MVLNKYTVYFELFGKKMKTDVEARNEEHAKGIVKSKIIFHKVQLNPLDFLKNMFGI